jgi:hypothetical protein
MKKYSIVFLSLAILISGTVALRMAIKAPARAMKRALAAMNSLSAGQTTEAELLSRKEFQTMDRMCMVETCMYHIEVQNTLLSKLHLAPPTFMWAMVGVRDGMVTSVTVAATRIGRPAISVTQVRTLPKECSATPCVQPSVLPNKSLMSISILFDSQSDLRNRLPQVVNAQCWSQLRGCATYAELIPLTKGMNLPADHSQGGVNK